MQHEGGGGDRARVAELRDRGVQVCEAPAGEPDLEVAVPRQPPRLGDADLVTQVGLEAIGVGTGHHLHPHQRMQNLRVTSHADIDTETGRPAVITPGFTWIRVTPSGASMSRMASALIYIHG